MNFFLVLLFLKVIKVTPLCGLVCYFDQMTSDLLADHSDIDKNLSHKSESSSQVFTLAHTASPLEGLGPARSFLPKWVNDLHILHRLYFS